VRLLGALLLIAGQGVSAGVAVGYYRAAKMYRARATAWEVIARARQRHGVPDLFDNEGT
jgi:hypothetical protein